MNDSYQRSHLDWGGCVAGEAPLEAWPHRSEPLWDTALDAPDVSGRVIPIYDYRIRFHSWSSRATVHTSQSRVAGPRRR